MYAPLASVNRYEPDYSHVRQSAGSACKTKPGVNTIAASVRASIEYPECGKVRGIFSATAVMTLYKTTCRVEQGYAEEQLTALIEEDPHVFICGAEMFPAEHALEKLVCKDNRLPYRGCPVQAATCPGE